MQKTNLARRSLVGIFVGLFTVVSCGRALAEAVRPVPAIKHVMIVSIDGLRPDVLLRANTPVMHGLMNAGSFTFWAKTTELSITLPSHTSMLTGVVPATHQILFNDDGPEVQVYPKVPTIFQLAKKAGYSTAMATGKSKFSALAQAVDWTSIPPRAAKFDDQTVAKNACQLIADHKPDLLFVHFPGADNVGHAIGWGTPQQIEAVEQIDHCLGEILDMLDKQKLRESTLIILTADHGGTGRWHGPNNKVNDPRARHIPWIAVGPGVKKNFDLASLRELNVNTEDTFATTASVLGLVPEQRIDGKPIVQALETPPASLLRDLRTSIDAPPSVSVVTPKRGPATMPLTIPGSLRPWQEVSMFARTTGHLKDFFVDIGEPVEKGKVMAIIDAPQVDRELAQANAVLQQGIAAQTRAKADRDLAKATRERYLKLRETQGVTSQQLDEKEKEIVADEAAILSTDTNIAAAKANILRLEEMKSFQEVKAPFTGIVTARAYDRGSLISADPTATDVRPLFKIAQNDFLRAFVSVPQSHAMEISKGMEVIITAREWPGVRFAGKVLGTTNYLDPETRSLLTEVKLENTKRANGEFSLLPGMFVTTTFIVKRDNPPWMIPASAITFADREAKIAIIQDGKVHLLKVTIGRDLGNEVEVTEGLKGDEKIITNPGEQTIEGTGVGTGM